MTEPAPPAEVIGNDWPSLAVDPLESWTPRRFVTVVVSYYQAPEALALTLAALEGQTYPPELFEVIVVDDGSDPPLAPIFDTPLSVRVVHQPDLGFGLARARNTGARAAGGEILVFLDCDMLPEAGWLAAHARWHHAASDVISIGFRSHVEVTDLDPVNIRSRPGSLADLFEGRSQNRPEWIEFHMVRTAHLTSDADDLFRVVTGGNFGISRAFFETVGGFDETFTQWGTEDIELGFRAFTRGGLLVPVRDAFCWHQGPGAAPDAEDRANLDFQRAKIAHLIAHHSFRRDRAGRSFTVPQYVVTVGQGSAPAEAIFETVEGVLASTVHDLVVWVEMPADAVTGAGDGPAGAVYGWLRYQFEPDPRVWFGPIGGALDCFPTSSFHVTIPAGITVGPILVRCLRWALSTAASGTARLDDGSEVSITRTWALHRARRTGLALVEVGEVMRLSPTGLGLAFGLRSVLVRLSTRRYFRWFRRFKTWALGAKPVAESKGHRRRPRSSRISILCRMLIQIRRPADLRQVLGWVGRGVRDQIIRRLIRRLPRRLTRGLTRRLVLPPGSPTDYLDISAIGPSVPARPIGSASVPEVPVQLSVPALDPTVVNPIGWTPDFDDTVVALGPPELLPLDVRARTTAALRPPAGSLEGLRRAHHVEDVAAYHDGVIQRATTLVELAAAGVVVHLADTDTDTFPGLRGYLGAELHRLMTASDIEGFDRHRRELVSICMRRAALRDHCLRSRAAQARALAAGIETRASDGGSTTVPVGPAWPPEVSVLLPTRRPASLSAAIDNVARQTYPRLELVLALHGDGFDTDALQSLVAGLDFGVQVVPVVGTLPLGRVLDAAVSASSGALLTKFDDDDVYGAEHVWDLVLAHEYSGAELVAKGAEYVYLAASDQTIHRFGGRGERFSLRPTVAGGAMLIEAQDLAAAGGWQPRPDSVDKALVDDIVRTGGRIYRTHGAGYVLVRHGVDHTWPAEDSYFLDQATLVRPGRNLTLAGIDA